MSFYTHHSTGRIPIDKAQSPVVKCLYADLVAAIHIGQALEEKCERLEAMLENAGDLAHNLQEENDDLRNQVLRLRNDNARLRFENAEFRKEIDRLELAS